jgi:hypothetical protein
MKPFNVYTKWKCDTSRKFFFPSFQLCITGSLDNLVHLKKPFAITSVVVFGSQNATSKLCPVEKSVIETTITFGSNDDANESYRNLVGIHGEKCNVIKFSPGPYAELCDVDKFYEILAINDFNMTMNFKRVCCAIFQFLFLAKNHIIFILDATGFL